MGNPASWECKKLQSSMYSRFLQLTECNLAPCDATKPPLISPLSSVTKTGRDLVSIWLTVKPIEASKSPLINTI
jgi:hypothetical protein